MVETLPRISIIIPVYNQQKVLHRALSSIAAQTHNNIEVIIIDDGSKIPIEQEKAQITALGFAYQEDNQQKKGGNIPLQVHRQENAGAAAARNKGFSYASGEFVIFWDADVIGRPYMVERLYVALKQQPECAFAYCNFYFGKKKMPSQAFNYKVLQQRNYISTMSLIRHSDFPGFDSGLHRFQDWDLWLTLAKKGKKGVWVNMYLFRAIPHKYGISSWLPRCAYAVPWKYLPGIKKRVRQFETAKAEICKKHQLD
ncbi:MAG: hypothetical protein CL685_00890 [Candidatus Magasanikbacteria bacterium]|nr:hypothetical protein [Candidatus Magasanikbacteria bacterium]